MCDCVVLIHNLKSIAVNARKKNRKSKAWKQLPLIDMMNANLN